MLVVTSSTEMVITNNQARDTRFVPMASTLSSFRRNPWNFGDKDDIEHDEYRRRACELQTDQDHSSSSAVVSSILPLTPPAPALSTALA